MKANIDIEKTKLLFDKINKQVHTPEEVYLHEVQAKVQDIERLLKMSNKQLKKRLVNRKDLEDDLKRYNDELYFIEKHILAPIN